MYQYWTKKRSEVEFPVYCLFLILYCTVVYGLRHPCLFHLTHILNSIFTSRPFVTANGRTIVFSNIRTISDFWMYTETIMLNYAYNEHWYDDRYPVRETEMEDRNVIYENKLLGIPRLRQLRVNSNSCVIEKCFTQTFSKCYDYFSEETESRETMKKGSQKWKYHTEEELLSCSYSGKAATYNGGGFIEDLDLNSNKSSQILKNLKNHQWIDRSTSVVFLDFTIFNINCNLFGILKLVFEFPPSGGVIPSSMFTTIRLLTKDSALDSVAHQIRKVLLIFIIYFTFEELYDIIMHFSIYIRSWWNLIELSLLFFAYASIAFHVLRFKFIEERVILYLENPLSHISFDKIANWELLHNRVAAVSLFFVWIKVIKYLTFSSTINQIHDTFTMCANDLIGFSVIFLIIYMAFAQMATLLFGSRVKSFRSILGTIITLLSIVLGDFSFEEMQNYGGVMGPVFFFAYIFFVFFILLNLIIAIINDTYTTVKHMKKIEDEYVRMKYLPKCLINLKNKYVTKKLLPFIKKVLPKDTEGKTIVKGDAEETIEEIQYYPGFLTINKIRMELDRNNFSDADIDHFIDYYKLTNNLLYSERRTYKFLNDLNDTSSDSSISDAERSKTQQKIERKKNIINGLRRRVDKMVKHVDKVLVVIQEKKTKKQLPDESQVQVEQ